MEPLAVEHYPLSLSKTSVALARQIGMSDDFDEQLPDEFWLGEE
jgi:hypothetical protein